jgi:hypothetical protein
MSISRILVSTTLIGALAACASPMSRMPSGIPSAPQSSITPTPIPAASPGDEAGLQNFVRQFRPRALSSGISASTYDRAMSLARYNPEVIRLDRRQAEFSRPVWLYLDSAVSDVRITTGRQKLAELNPILARIEAQYGVPREVVLAVWGMESNFGANRGRMQIIPSLATLAYDGRRGEMFQNQLIAALQILQAGDTDPQHMLINKVLDRLIVRFDRVKDVIDGRPIMLVRDGCILHDDATQRDLGLAEIKSMLRLAGIGNLGEVRAAYLEAGGGLSVFRRSDPVPGLSLLPPDHLVNGGPEPDKALAMDGRTCCALCGAGAEAQTLADPAPCPRCGGCDWQAPEWPEGAPRTEVRAQPME